jgi:hypothetical protein
MKLGSDNEPHPSRILYIGPSKRLNDYYAPKVAGSDAAHRIEPVLFLSRRIKGVEVYEPQTNKSIRIEPSHK